MHFGALSWNGGKSPKWSVNRWIADSIPWTYDNHYIEPFAGMLGILLQRGRQRVETVNDANERLINWWRVIRDQPEAFGRALDWTPQHARREYESCVDDLDCDDPIRRAVAFTVVVSRGVRKSDKNKAAQYSPMYGGRTPERWETPDVMALYHRIKYVQLESMDAVSILERVSGNPDTTVYCDPPYTSADCSAYSHAPDIAAMTDALHSQRGKVAISGYGDEWDHLGWRCEEHESFTGTLDSRTKQRIEKRTVEKLWMNYDSPQPRLF